MKAIRHIGIVVRDLEKMLHFYGDLLGLKVVKDQDELGNYIDIIVGLKNTMIRTVKMEADDGSLIELLYFQSHPQVDFNEKKLCNLGISHIAFTVKNLDLEYQRLLKAGVEFISSPQKSTDGFAKVVFCKDLESNFIELVEELHF